MKTGGMMFADGGASSSDWDWKAFIRYKALAGMAEPAVLICRQKSLVSWTKKRLLSARSDKMSCSRRSTSFFSPSSSRSAAKEDSRFSEDGYETSRGRSVRRLIALRIEGKMHSVANR